MRYSDEIIEEVRSRNDIVDVISTYVALKKQGSNYFGLCPFHNEKTPSFCVSPSKQMFYCFGCGAGGNVISFIMQYENVPFPDALKTLADRVSMTLPVPSESGAQKQERDLISNILAANKLAGTFYYCQLRSAQGSPGLEYFKSRQLSDKTIRDFGLGYAGNGGDTLYRYLKQKDFSDELLRSAGLVTVDEKRGVRDKFWDRVMFPIMDVNCHIVAFGGRVLGDGKPKYLNTPETRAFNKSRVLYGLHAARKSRKKQILVCEGYMDVISMHQAGFTNSVACLGTAMTGEHALILKRYTQDVILTYDSDTAGTNATLRAIPLLMEAGLNVKVLQLAPYKDPDELIKAQGMEGFQKRIDEAQNGFMFAMEAVAAGYNLRDPGERAQFFKEAARRISQLDSALARETYIQAVVEKYGISAELLRNEVINCLRLDTRQRKPQPVFSGNPASKKEEGILRSQRMLLTWLADYPKFYETVKECLSPADFEEGVYRETATLLFAQLEQGNVNPAAIVGHFTDPQEQSQVAKLFHTNEETRNEADLKKAMRETLKKVMDASLKTPGGTGGADNDAYLKVLEKKKLIQRLDKLEIIL